MPQVGTSDYFACRNNAINFDLQIENLAPKESKFLALVLRICREISEFFRPKSITGKLTKRIKDLNQLLASDKYGESIQNFQRPGEWTEIYLIAWKKKMLEQRSTLTSKLNENLKRVGPPSLKNYAHIEALTAKVKVFAQIQKKEVASPRLIEEAFFYSTLEHIKQLLTKTQDDVVNSKVALTDNRKERESQQIVQNDLQQLYHPLVSELGNLREKLYNCERMTHPDWDLLGEIENRVREGSFRQQYLDRIASLQAAFVLYRHSHFALYCFCLPSENPPPNYAEEVKVWKEADIEKRSQLDKHLNESYQNFSEWIDANDFPPHLKEEFLNQILETIPKWRELLA